MRIDQIRSFRKAYESKATLPDKSDAHELMAGEILKLINEKKLDPKKISFRALVEGLTDFSFNGRTGGKAPEVRMAEAITGSAFPVITNVILNALTFPELTLYSNDLLGLITEGTARVTEAEKIGGTTELGQPLRRPEATAYQEDEFGEKDITIYKADFGRIISLTFEAIYNDNTGMIMDRARTIGKTAGQQIHTTIVQTIEGLPRTAFEESTSRAFVYKDTAYTADSIYADTHTTIDGQTNDNDVVGGISETGLENAYNAFKQMTDSRGNVLQIGGTQVLTHSIKEITMSKLLKTVQQGAGESGTQIYPCGPAGGITLSPVYTPFMSNSAWVYMGDFKAAVVWLWVERPNMVTAPANENLAFEKKIVHRARFNYFGGCGLRDYRFIVRVKPS